MRRVVVVKTERVRFRSLDAGLRAAHEHRIFVFGERRFEIVRMRGDCFAELRAIVHGEVRAFAVGRREMSRVADERHAGHALPL